LFNCRLVISFLVLTLVGCGKPDVQRKEVIVLGHGGAGFPGINNHYAPNSEESIKQALLMHDADGVEVDIQLSQDSQVVLFHDGDLQTSTNGNGFVSAHDWKDLNLITYNRVGTVINAKQHLWRLEDLLSFITDENLNVWLSLNVQPQSEVTDKEAYNQQFQRSLSHLLKNYGLNTKVVVESRDVANLAAFQPLTGMGIELFYTKNITSENIQTALQHDFSGFVTNYLDETSESIDLLRSHNLKLALYGVKIRQDILPALKFSPDMVQTDNIPLVLSYLGE